MIRKTIYTLTMFLGIFMSDIAAQNSQTMYFMNIPQNHLLNPALRPSNSLYIGLPAISGINMNINNNFVNFSDVFIKDQSSDQIISFLHPDYNVDDFLDKIKDKNSLEPEVAVQLFGLGFSVGKSSYIFLDINERVNGNVVLPGDLFVLGLKGNEGFLGSKIDLSSLRGDVKYYREAGLGFSKNFSNKLRIGVKGKLLFGIAAASIDNRSLGITVNEDYTHTLDANMVINISAPVIVTRDAGQHVKNIAFDDSRFKTSSGITSFLSETKNMGLGLDIGATYDISNKLKVSAAITDLGFIKWKNDITNLQADGQFIFSGFDMTKVLSNTMTFDSLANQMLDSLKNAFLVSDSKIPFTTYLPVGVSFGGSYNLTKRFSLGLLSYTRFIGKQIRESLTLSTNLNLSNAFSASLSYTAANHRYDNLGAGLAFRAGIVQFYIIGDRIPIMWNKIIIDNGNIPLPTSWNTINLRFGINLVFGNKVKKKDDKPMVQVD